MSRTSTSSTNPSRSRRILPLLLSLSLVASLPPAARSSDQDQGTPAPVDPAPAPQVTEQIVVTASRVEQPLESVPGNVTVLDEELQRSAALAIDDLLRQVPGFSLFRRASSLVSHPTTQGLSLRGIAPSGVSRTLVLLDGIPLNDAFGGWVYWSRVPQAGLERVEIVRGGGSSVWGSDALGGVLHLITAQPAGLAVDLLGQAGERGTLHGSAFAADEAGPALLSLAADVFETDGYATIRADQRGLIDVPATSEHWSLSGRARFAPTPGSDLTLRASAFDEDRGNGTPLTGNATQNEAGAISGNHAGRSDLLSWSLLAEQQDFSSTFSAQEEDRSSERPSLDQFLVDARSLRTSLQWSGVRRGARSEHALIAGGEYRWVEGATNEDFLFTTEFERRRQAGGEQQVGGVYLQDRLTLGELELTLGARVDRWRSLDGFLIESVIADGSVLNQQRFADRSETQLSPRVGVLFGVGPGSSVFVSGYRSFRAPTINELYRPFRVRNDITAANAQLEPETLLGAEAGYRWGSRGHGFELTGFWSQLDDAVANVTLAFGPGSIPPCGFVPAGGSCQQRQNLERTRIAGVEAEYRRSLSQRLELLASYLYSDSEIRKAGNAPHFEGNRVGQVPEHQVVLKLDYRGPLDVALQGRYVGAQFEGNLNTRELEDFVVLDLYLARALGKGLSLFVGVENLLDQEIEVGETADGLVTTGAPRLVHGGVRFRMRD